MNYPVQQPSLQIWIALKDVEEYIRGGIVNQMNGAESFGGDDMQPLKEAFFLCERLKPMLSAPLYKEAQRAIQTAADGLNGMLASMRIAAEQPPHLRQKLMILACDSARGQTLGNYQLVLSGLEPMIGKEAMVPANIINNFRVENNFGIINWQAVLTDVTQSISCAESLDSDKKDRLKTLFVEFTKQLEAAPSGNAEEVEIAAEQAKELAAEIGKPKPRQTALLIKGSGLIEAAKALANVIPIALSTAKQIVEFIGST